MLARLFIRVLAITIGVTLAIGGAGGGIWWYLENRTPDMVVELIGFTTPEHEDEDYWAFILIIENRETKDYPPGTWRAIAISDDDVLLNINLQVELVQPVELLARQKVRITLRTNYPHNNDKFPVQTMANTPDDYTIEEAEIYIQNIKSFRDAWGVDGLLLINDSIKLRQKISLQEFYDKELARRQEILTQFQADSDT